MKSILKHTGGAPVFVTIQHDNLSRPQFKFPGVKHHVEPARFMTTRSKPYPYHGQAVIAIAPRLDMTAESIFLETFERNGYVSGPAVIVGSDKVVFLYRDGSFGVKDSAEIDDVTRFFEREHDIIGLKIGKPMMSFLPNLVLNNAGPR